jgi:hypothetical protein
MPPLEAAFPFRLDVPRLQSVVRVQGFGPVDLMVTQPAVVPLDRVLLNNDFLALDVNGDRFVTLSEWTGPRPLFWRLDTNRDRRVVYTELVAPTYQPAYVTAPVYAPLRSTVLVGRDRFVQFDLLDRSNDGLIAPWEWTGDMDLFFLLDRNGDGLVEQPEFLGVGVARPVVPVRMVVDGALDLDHDGYVSRWEWVGDPFRFAALDLNGNGRLGRVEAVIGTAL